MLDEKKLHNLGLEIEFKTNVIILNFAFIRKDYTRNCTAS